MGNKFIKKVLSSMLIFSMAITSTCYVFGDVGSNYYDYGQIKYLEDKGILSDITRDGTFDYDDLISREEFVTMVVKACYSTLDITNKIEFQDENEVNENLITYIQKALEEKIIVGVSVDDNISVRPKQFINREQATTIIAKAIDVMSYEDLKYGDNEDISSYAVPYISGIRSSNIVNSFDDNSFRPKSNISKAEAAKMIYNMVRRQMINQSLVKTYIDFASQNEIINPIGITKDNDDNLIVVGMENSIIKKISNGNVSSVAGRIVIYDEYGFAMGLYADGKTKEALFNKPTYVSVDSKNQIIVSDTGNNLIRIISEGYVKTLSGQTKAGYKDGSASEALFNNPTGVTVDKNDNIYVVDTLNNCIRKIDTKGNVTTLTGKQGESGYRDGKVGEALFNEPTGIAIDKDNVIYVTDTGNQRIRKIENGEVETIAGGGSDYIDDSEYIVGDFIDGSGAEARFNFPQGICVTDNGTLIVADTFNHSIRAINKTKDVITIAGNSDVGCLNTNSLESSFNAPKGILYIDQKIYIADSLNNIIRVIDFDELSLKDFGF